MSVIPQAYIEKLKTIFSTIHSHPYASSSHNHDGEQITPASIEFSPSTTAGNGGFIDFHYNGNTDSSIDNTARIIEDEKGSVNVISRLCENGVRVSTEGHTHTKSEITDFDHSHDFADEIMLKVYTPLTLGVSGYYELTTDNEITIDHSGVLILTSGFWNGHGTVKVYIMHDGKDIGGCVGSDSNATTERFTVYKGDTVYGYNIGYGSGTAYFTRFILEYIASV